ncbi:MAG: universal stress protein [Polyangiaceae bacterium]|nr:universal stress protein [Polyangiaceae bacterium]
MRRLAVAFGVEVHTHLAAGSVSNALTSVAEWELADALLVGASEDSALRPLGGTAERISRRGRVPVLTLREPGRLLAWLRGERPLRVLVGAARPMRRKGRPERSPSTTRCASEAPWTRLIRSRRWSSSAGRGAGGRGCNDGARVALRGLAKRARTSRAVRAHARARLER